MSCSSTDSNPVGERAALGRAPAPAWRVALRADATPHIGSGHLRRCLTLARELRRAGAHCHFFCQPLAPELARLVAACGAELTCLPEGAADAPEPLLAALGGASFDWLIVDHYGIGASTEARWRRHVGRLMVIADQPGRWHDCDLLLDQNWRASAVDGPHWPGAARCLCGPAYALLDEEYRQLRSAPTVRDGRVRRILLSFGGGDEWQLTLSVCRWLLQPEFAALELDVVLGPLYPAPARVRNFLAGRAGTRVHAAPPSLARLMQQADLMIGAGGTTTWERMCLGLPALAVAIADNQALINRDLARAGYQVYLGRAAELDADRLVGALRAALDSPETLQAQSRAMQDLVDGEGAQRVGAEMQTMMVAADER